LFFATSISWLLKKSFRIKLGQNSIYHFNLAWTNERRCNANGYQSTSKTNYCINIIVFNTNKLQFLITINLLLQPD